MTNFELGHGWFNSVAIPFRRTAAGIEPKVRGCHFKEGWAAISKG
jgi:hypothetical protein